MYNFDIYLSDMDSFFKGNEVDSNLKSKHIVPYIPPIAPTDLDIAA